MRREDVLAVLKDHQGDFDRFGVKSLRLFGSTARDEAVSESDVDLLVAFEATPAFSDFMKLQIFLEELLGAKVDLVTETGLRDRVRSYVEKDAIRVVTQKRGGSLGGQKAGDLPAEAVERAGAAPGSGDIEQGCQRGLVQGRSVTTSLFHLCRQPSLGIPLGLRVGWTDEIFDQPTLTAERLGGSKKPSLKLPMSETDAGCEATFCRL